MLPQSAPSRCLLRRRTAWEQHLPWPGWERSSGCPPPRGAGVRVMQLEEWYCILGRVVWGISSSYALNRAPGSLLAGPGPLLAVQHVRSPTFRCSNCTPELCSQSRAPRAAPRISVCQRTGSLALPLPAFPTAGQTGGGGNNAGQGGGRPASGTAAAASSSLGGARIAAGPRGGARGANPGAVPSAVPSAQVG